MHKLGNKFGWDDGSIGKIALHAFVGKFMAELGGGDGKTGAISAAVNEALIKEIGKLPVELQQMASAILGKTIAQMTGGNSNTGASIAASATKNNWLNTTQQEALKRDMRNAKTDKEKLEVIAKALALSKANIDVYGEPEEGEAIIRELYDYLDGLHIGYSDAGGNKGY